MDIYEIVQYLVELVTGVKHWLFRQINVAFGHSINHLLHFSFFTNALDWNRNTSSSSVILYQYLKPLPIICSRFQDLNIFGRGSEISPFLLPGALCSSSGMCYKYASKIDPFWFSSPCLATGKQNTFLLPTFQSSRSNGKRTQCKVPHGFELKLDWKYNLGKYWLWWWQRNVDYIWMFWKDYLWPKYLIHQQKSSFDVGKFGSLYMLHTKEISFRTSTNIRLREGVKKNTF